MEGTDQAQEGIWTFFNSDEPLPFIFWAPGQPDNLGGNEDCLVIWGGLQVGIVDATCGVWFDVSLCEVDQMTSP